MCLLAEAVWHLDCDRAKGTGVAIASSLPPSSVPPLTPTNPTTTSNRSTISSSAKEGTNKPSYGKTSKPMSDIRPASENYTRNGKREIHVHVYVYY